MSMNRRWLAMAAAGLVSVVGLAGCGAGSGDDAGGGDAGGQAPGAAERDAGAAAPEDPEQPDDGGAAGGALVDTRSIIYTGTITVRVTDVDDAAGAATELAQRHGGFVGGDRRSAAGAEDGQATLVLRIPSSDFTAAVDELGALGEEESRELSTEDVTEEVVDLETRIATAEASVERTRTLLERAESIDDIVAVEAELSEREAALASLQARQRRLADLTTLSTITVTLLAQEAAAAPEPDRSGFLAGLSAGWRGFTRSMTVLLTGFGVLLPWLVAVGAPTAAGVWWSRRRRALRAGMVTAAGTAPATAPIPAPAPAPGAAPAGTHRPPASDHPAG
ncbi:MAG: DUF4349 domain-containing protein [Micromonosporaceae bacterium]|nr:DUF4349 domain-containing protein [Micromonosporaceae bacterium]